MKKIVGIASIMMVHGTALTMDKLGVQARYAGYETYTQVLPHDVKFSVLLPYLTAGDVTTVTENVANYFITLRGGTVNIPDLLPPIIKALSTKFKENPLKIALRLNKAGLTEAKNWIAQFEDDLVALIAEEVPQKVLAHNYSFAELLLNYDIQYGLEPHFLERMICSSPDSLFTLLLNNPVSRKALLPVLGEVWKHYAENRELKIKKLAQVFGLKTLMDRANFSYLSSSSTFSETFRDLAPYLKEHPEDMVVVVEQLQRVPFDLLDATILQTLDERGRNLFMNLIECGTVKSILHNQLRILGSLYDVNARDNKGQTALMLAAQHGDLETVKFLLENAPVSVLIEDKAGKTVFTYARGNALMEDYLSKYLKRPLTSLFKGYRGASMASAAC